MSNVVAYVDPRWIITPVAVAPNDPFRPEAATTADPPPVTPGVHPGIEPSAFPALRNQRWLVVLTGVAVTDLAGNDDRDWRHETVFIMPDITPALQFVVDGGHTLPPPRGTFPGFAWDQCAPFAAVSSLFDKEAGAVDAGFAVDAWRPAPGGFADIDGNNILNSFAGIEVDVALRNSNARLSRVSYHITLIGRIVFFPIDPRRVKGHKK